VGKLKASSRRKLPETFFGVPENTRKDMEEGPHSESHQRKLKKSFTTQFLHEHLKSHRPRDKN